MSKQCSYGRLHKKLLLALPLHRQQPRPWSRPQVQAWQAQVELEVCHGWAMAAQQRQVVAAVPHLPQQQLEQLEQVVAAQHHRHQPHSKQMVMQAKMPSLNRQ